MADLLVPLAEGRRLRVEVEGDPDIEVRADPVLLRQAVMNLIDNAIAFSPEQGRIGVRVVAVDREVSIEVEDHGPGVPEEHREKIFGRFHRVEASRARRPGGAGLGLAIAAWVVEAHGGRIGVRCPPEGGSTFSLALPPG